MAGRAEVGLVVGGNVRALLFRVGKMKIELLPMDNVADPDDRQYISG